jgi:hypothetical protein
MELKRPVTNPISVKPPQRLTVYFGDISWFVRFEDGTTKRICRHEARRLLIQLLGTRQKAERWLDQLRVEAARRNHEHCITPSFGTYSPEIDACHRNGQLLDERENLMRSNSPGPNSQVDFAK